MKCLSLTYYQSQQLQDINRKPPRPPIAHIATLSHWIGKHTTNTTGERIAQMVSNGGGYQIIESDTTNGHRPPFRLEKKILFSKNLNFLQFLHGRGIVKV